MKYIATIKIVADKDIDTIKNALSNGLGFLLDISQEVTAEIKEVND